jgi:hypothetical protein
MIFTTTMKVIRTANIEFAVGGVKNAVYALYLHDPASYTYIIGKTQQWLSRPRYFLVYKPRQNGCQLHVV